MSLPVLVVVFSVFKILYMQVVGNKIFKRLLKVFYQCFRGIFNVLAR